MIGLLIGALATWTFSSMLVGERGPFDLFVKIRQLAGVHEREDSEAELLNYWMELHPGQDVPDHFAFNLLGEILSCLWCTSMWVSFGVCLVLWADLEWLLVPFAIRTIVIAVDEFINGSQLQ